MHTTFTQIGYNLKYDPQLRDVSAYNVSVYAILKLITFTTISSLSKLPLSVHGFSDASSKLVIAHGSSPRNIYLSPTCYADSTI
jgi:hypothetical protein